MRIGFIILKRMLSKENLYACSIFSTISVMMFGIHVLGGEVYDYVNVLMALRLVMMMTLVMDLVAVFVYLVSVIRGWKEEGYKFSFRLEQEDDADVE